MTNNTPIRTVSIYVLINPINNHIFYVGCTSNPMNRIKGHLSEKHKTKKYEMIEEIRLSGHDVKFRIIEECDAENASNREVFYIGMFKSCGFQLVNQNSKSEYLKVHSKKFILNQGITDMSTMIFPTKLTNGLKSFAKRYNVKVEELIEIAIEDFLKNYEGSVRVSEALNIKLDIRNSLRRKYPHLINPLSLT